MKEVEPKILPHVEKFFQIALVGLVASGYLAIIGSGYVDSPTLIFAGVGLLWRAAIVLGAERLRVPDRAVTFATVAYMIFAPFDYFYLAQTWITASVHVVFFIASVKLLAARVARDYLFVAAVAFVELLAAALFSASGMFFVCLMAYLLCAVGALSSAEIRRLTRPPYEMARVRQARTRSRLAGMAGIMTLGILLLSAGLFFLLPRTANAALHFFASNRYHLTGFSNDVTLGEVGDLKTDPRAVMHIRALPAMNGGHLLTELPLNQKWRGLALEHFDGYRWSTNPSSFRTARPDERLGLIKLADDWQRRRTGKRVLYRVEIQNVDADALFVAGIPEFLNASGTRVSRSSSGALRFGFVPSENVRYEVYSYLGSPGTALENSEVQRLSSSDHEQNLQLPTIDPRIRDLARTWTEGTDSDFERAKRIESRLRNDYGYSLDLPTSEPKDPVASFLFDRRSGYCEYFASAMTIMLRTLQIPSRLVNGFQSGILNPYSGTLVIRASDAHTWVEAYLPQSGWTVFDPTPLAGRSPPQSMWNKVALYMDAADTFWRDWVLSYDLSHQLALATHLQGRARDFRQVGFQGWIEWLRSTRETLLASSHQKALFIFAFSVCVVALLFFGRKWHWRVSPHGRQGGPSESREATILYLKALDHLKRRGYQKPAWLTAEEFASSIHTDSLDRLTIAYYAVRFGGQKELVPEIAESLQAISLDV